MLTTSNLNNPKITSNCIFPQDSIFRKSAATFPIIGLVIGIWNEKSLIRDEKPKHFVDQPFLNSIKLLEIKNHYKISSIISNFFSITILIALLATKIITGVTPIALGGVSCVFLFSYILAQSSYLLKNKKAIQTLAKIKNELEKPTKDPLILIKEFGHPYIFAKTDPKDSTKSQLMFLFQ